MDCHMMSKPRPLTGANASTYALMLSLWVKNFFFHMMQYSY